MTMIDRVFGRWTVIGSAEKAKSGSRRWMCRCTCGSEKPVYERYLIAEASTSCGCFRKELLLEKNTTHGHNARGKRTTEYNSWASMIQRCTEPNNPEWPNYGGRGIRVCERWRNSFEAFLVDMGPKPTPRHQIDRHPNNDGHYEPGNCRWATPLQNARNKRNTVYLEHDGKRLPQSQWSKITGISQATLCERRAAGWSDSEVLTTPKTPGRKHP
jgi:hypothetical protein